MFSQSTLQTVSREMAGQEGVEKTPAEWQMLFIDMVAEYRRLRPEATKLLSDEQVFDLIRAKMRNL